ncbi:TonB-dependent receptor domain-containing protein [Paracoccus seriniphilus]|uniref:Outer membrane receptor for ferrienterochelin and colicins n=1 Tax=Paracoccus seriniphilus TaxID=184748 RepID=A0A239PN92_9RHOB|nr:TonB-dependent receptor [Paracoccus seriniphilus]WCR14802.1 TonB-dependent receptor [Paracoccus seriniphilus]SNT71784.1 outer membrane receptor for ferrienterochelin and colicins [Paracoccus seriniphilus]
MTYRVSGHLGASTALGSVLSIVFTSHAVAQDVDLAGTTTLSPIVVTAGGFEQNVADAPASVSVITRQQLEERNVTSLSDALSDVQGVVTTGAADNEDIFIRGLPGEYTLILVDGKRQGTRDSRPNGSSGFEQSFIPPVAAIERIEVVRGPMSSLYGSDAMGGVVNIITRKVSPEWTGSVTAETVIPEHSTDSGNKQLSFYLSGPIVDDRLGLQLWGRRMWRDEAEQLDGPSEEDDIDLSGRLTWMVTPDQELNLEYGYTELEQYSNPGMSLDEGDDPERVDNEREHLSLGYVGYWGDATTELSLLRERGQRTTYNYDLGYFVKDERSPEITNTVVDGKVTLPFEMAGSHTVVSGFQLRRSELKDQNPGTGTTDVQTFSSDEWSVFAEDEWQITPQFAVTGGLRYTDNDGYGGKVTPRIYGVWSNLGGLTIKGGVSTGYRTPSLRQAVDDYYYTTERGAGVIVSNPDLDPETSTSYELSALLERPGYELGATLYRTDFKDKIENYKTGETIDVGGTTYNRWEYINVQDATIQGVELTASVDLSPTLRLTGNYTLTDSEQNSGTYKGLPLARTPEHAANLKLDWMTPVAGLNAWTSATYHGSEINAGARIGSNGTPYAYDDDGDVIAYKYDNYTTVDLGLSYEINERARLEAAIYNVLDAEVSVADNNAYQTGRSLWLSVTTSF